MAKPREAFKIKKEYLDNYFTVIVGNLNSSEVATVAMSIEGVAGVTRYTQSLHKMSVECNPCYDRDEIIAELEQLLSPVPDAFYEDTTNAD